MLNQQLALVVDTLLTTRELPQFYRDALAPGHSEPDPKQACPEPDSSELSINFDPEPLRAGEIQVTGGKRAFVSKVTMAVLDGKISGVDSTGRLYMYSLVDLALLFGLSQGYLKQLITNGDFDPTDLESICHYWYRRVRSSNYKRQWPITEADRVREIEALRATRRKKDLCYRDAAGKEQKIVLPDL